MQENNVVTIPSVRPDGTPGRAYHGRRYHKDLYEYI